MPDVIVVGAGAAGLAAASQIHEIATAHGLASVDVAENRYLKSRTRFEPMRDFWPRLDRVMRRLDDTRDPDRSFADALQANRRSLAAADRMLARQFVEGFHAADTTVISERALADGGTPCDDVRETRIGRLLGGYGSLMDVLANPVRARVRLGVVVSAVRWGRKQVDVECRDRSGAPLETMSARAIVITVPLGVLDAGWISRRDRV